VRERGKERERGRERERERGVEEERRKIEQGLDREGECVWGSVRERVCEWERECV